MAEALRKCGPLSMFRDRTHGGQAYGHAAVIIGIRADTVIFHDPENAPHGELSFAGTTATLLAGWPMLKRDALPFGSGAAVRR